MRNPNNRRNKSKTSNGGHDIKATISLIAIWTARFIIAAAVTWFIIWNVYGDSLPNIGYINAAAIPIGFAALFCGAFLLYRRSYIGGGIGVIFFCIIFSMGSGFNISASQARITGGDDVRIVSASLRGLNKNMNAAAKRLAQYDGDIIVLQEVSDLPAFTKKLTAITGTKWYYSIEKSYAVLAQYPTSIDKSDNKKLSAIRVDLPQKPIVIWNIHAAKSYSRPAENRSYYVNLLDDLKIHNPDMIIGDFNATPWNYGYRLIDKHMLNAHQQAGFGPGASFPARGRSIGILGAFSRIDHIFVRPEYAVVNAFTANASQGADHHPVIADIIL